MWFRQDEHFSRRSVIAVMFRRQMTQRWEPGTVWELGPLDWVDRVARDSDLDFFFLDG